MAEMGLSRATTSVANYIAKYPPGHKSGERSRKTGESSRSRTRARRHTVALNSSRAEGDHHEPHPAHPPLRGRTRRARCCPGGVRRHTRIRHTAAARADAGPPPGPVALAAGWGVPGFQVVSRQVHTAVTGGMPGWQITLIAVAAALLAATVAVLVDRAWASRLESSHHGRLSQAYE